MKQKETIARGIANQIYREIQAAGKNKVSHNWLVNAIHVCIKADKSVVDDITALTIETLAGNTSGAVLRRIADGYGRTCSHGIRKPACDGLCIKHKALKIRI